MSLNMKRAWNSFLSLVIATSIIVPVRRVYARGSDEGERPSCDVSAELSLEERSAISMFHAKLSHLLNHWGRPTFSQKLEEIVRKDFPRPMVMEPSPFFMEKALNLVDQAKLKNSIALTIGTDDEDWTWFDQTMRTISVMGMTGHSLMHPLDRTTINILKKIKASKKRDVKQTTAEFEVVKAEALARLADMHTYLLRWRVLNGQMIDDRAAASAKTVAVVALGLVGGGVLVSTLVVSAPIVAGAGTAAAGLSTNPVVAALLVKVAETAAGAAIGFVGAPAAVIAQDSYHTMSEAVKQSKNRGTSLSCELGIEMDRWAERAPGRLAIAAATGAGIGLAGGALTFTSASAKLVLYATGLGVGVAQLYAVGKMSIKTVESLVFYRLAEEAMNEGDRTMAVRHLHRARDLAQEAGEFALESVIIATLSYHVSHHFMSALRGGSGEIRKLYAASADTLPTAARAAIKMTTSVRPILAGDSISENQMNCPSNIPNDINCVIDAGAMAGIH